MPTYEYRCENCGIYEMEQRMSEKTLSKCPKCGGAVKRLISASGIVFKGSGFHVTDYGKEKQISESSKKTEKPQKTESKKEETKKEETKKEETKKATD